MGKVDDAKTLAGKLWENTFHAKLRNEVIEADIYKMEGVDSLANCVYSARKRTKNTIQMNAKDTDIFQQASRLGQSIQSLEKPTLFIAKEKNFPGIDSFSFAPKKPQCYFKLL